MFEAESKVREGATGRFSTGPARIVDGFEREHQVFDRSIGRRALS